MPTTTETNSSSSETGARGETIRDHAWKAILTTMVGTLPMHGVMGEKHSQVEPMLEKPRLDSMKAVCETLHGEENDRNS
jgi:hypothetical protein